MTRHAIALSLAAAYLLGVFLSVFILDTTPDELTCERSTLDGLPCLVCREGTALAVSCRWIRGERGRQKALADETGIPQQSLSNYALRISRPSERRARRIEIAIRKLTGGDCATDGWLTKKEQREEAAHLGRRVA